MIEKKIVGTQVLIKLNIKKNLILELYRVYFFLYFLLILYL